MPHNPRTRDRLLTVGLEALRELDVADLVSAVGTRELARRAEVSVGTFFHHFDSTRDFADALVQHLYDPGRPAPSELEIGVHASSLGGATLPRAAAMDLHRGELARLMADPEHLLRVGLAGLGGAHARHAYGNYLRVRDLPLRAVAEQVFGGWGRELRPPMSWSVFIAVHAALLSGSAMRERCDPGSIAPDMFARSAMSLSTTMVRPIGEGRDLDSRLGEINYYAVRGRDTARRRGSAERGQRLLAAASALFAEHDYESVTMSQIARAAGLSHSGVYGLVADKADLAVRLLLDQAPQLLAPDVDTDTDTDTDTDDDPALDRRARLARRVTDLAEFLQLCGPLLGPYVHEVVILRRVRDDDPVRARIELAVADALSGEAGDETGDGPADGPADPARVAGVLFATVAQQLLAGVDYHDVAALAVRVVLGGPCPAHPGTGSRRVDTA